MRNNAEPTRVLLVDDDELSREILELVLGGAGYVVVTATSGAEALEVLGETEEFTVVLADLQMPGLAGAELAGRLRVAAKRSVLIAMSGTNPKADAADEYDTFLLKPFSVESFAAAVRTPRRGLGLASGPEAGVEPFGPVVGVVDEAKLAAMRSAFRPAQLQELFRFALTDAERQLDTMRLAQTAGNETLYCRCAHSMKGSFGMLGVPELWGLANAAEREGLPSDSTLADEVTTFVLFEGALSRLRHTLITRGICHE